MVRTLEPRKRRPKRESRRSTGPIFRGRRWATSRSKTSFLTLFEAQAAEFGGKLAAAASHKARLDLVHTLKGAARAIGAVALGDAAEDYETALAQARETEARGADTGARDTTDRLEALGARLGEARQAISARLQHL